MKNKFYISLLSCLLFLPLMLIPNVADAHGNGGFHNGGNSRNYNNFNRNNYRNNGYRRGYNNGRYNYRWRW